MIHPPGPEDGANGVRSPLSASLAAPCVFRRWAATAAEFAIVAPIFFTFILGLFELGRGYMVQHLMTNAARQGCRVAVIEGKTSTDVNNAVYAVLNGEGISGDAVTVQVNDASGNASSAQSGDEITVTVSIPASTVSWIPAPSFYSERSPASTPCVGNERQKGIAMLYFASRSRSSRRRRAVAAVEFAVVAPFLFFLAMGAFETGRAIMIRQTLTDAARKACRMGTLPNKANSDITSDANDILTDNSIPTSAATITILVNGASVDVSTAQPGDQISVKVSVPYNKVAWTPLLFFTNSSIDSETLVMMRQG